jgi:hypothetical protein
MATPNPQRAEVALVFGDGHLILRPSFPTIAKLKPYLFGASDEVKAERHRWLAITQAQYGTEPPPVERMGWHHHLLGALAADEFETVSRSILILAEEHHPEMTFEQVMDESPSYGLIWRTFMDLSEYFHWRPGQAPEVPKEKDERPFDPRTLLRMLSILRPRTASVRPNSGH